MSYPSSWWLMDDQLDRLAEIGGTIGATVGFAVPIALWFYVLRPWKPRGRFSYALRWAAWPLVVMSFNIGKPIMLLVIGFPSENAFAEFGLGMVGSAMLIGLPAFIVGWIYGGVMKDFGSGPDAAGVT